MHTVYRNKHFPLFRTIKAKVVKTHSQRLGKTKTTPLRLQTDSHSAFSEGIFLFSTGSSSSTAGEEGELPKAELSAVTAPRLAPHQGMPLVQSKGCQVFPAPAARGSQLPEQPGLTPFSPAVGEQDHQGAACLLLPAGQSCSFCHLS